MAPFTGLRRVLAALFLFGSVGTAAELILLEHYEDFWQYAPLLLIGIGSAVLVVLAVRPSAIGVRLFQITMLAFIASGIAGIVLHYQGNVEFELELDPEAAGFGLFWEAMKGATPALAPGTMVVLGVLGLICAYRDPAAATP
jgi:hypothetical protein